MSLCLQNVGLEMSSVVNDCVGKEKNKQGQKLSRHLLEYLDALAPLPSVASLTLPNLSYPIANEVSPPRTVCLHLIA